MEIKETLFVNKSNTDMGANRKVMNEVEDQTKHSGIQMSV